MDWRVTSGPIPSPRITAIFFFIASIMLFFVLFYVFLQADQKINIIISIQQAGFLVMIDLKLFLFACGINGNGLVGQAYCERCILSLSEYLLQKFFGYLNGQHTIVQGIVL